MEINEKFNLAAELVLYTSQSMFLTGKAGTGKTTFLRHIKNNTTKNTVIVAPTGVAAINAGGMTMHSFFQLPLQSYVPKSGLSLEQNPHIVTPNTLFDKIRLASTKRDLFKELELLIIDEVSMVSADMLDCTDQILRSIRKRQEPFGGVQVLFIGDLYQLPPVVSEQSWEVLREYYESPFFFESWAIKKMDLLFLELEKIYRQNDENFIRILNNVRNNQVTEEDLEQLHERYYPDFDPSDEEGYITLTTHNNKADIINNNHLAKLSASEFAFKAELKGEFNEKALPTEQNLILKVGAQVMFIRNDTSTDKRYYNGKLGVIKDIVKTENSHDIIVAFKGEDDYLLEREKWESIRYKYNEDTGGVTEEEIGSFVQYPIRLAWAITIHKSQGLTFDRAIIDAGSSFAAGQVYVALSRCTSLGGIVLKSKIDQRAIKTDERIALDNKFTKDNEALKRLVEIEKELFIIKQIKRVFYMDKMVEALKAWSNGLYHKKIPALDQVLRMSKDIVSKAEEIERVADKFLMQLETIFREMKDNADDTTLNQRMEKSIEYFTIQMGDNIVLPLLLHAEDMKNASKVKAYLTEVKHLIAVCQKKIEDINYVKNGDKGFAYNEEILKKYIDAKETKETVFKKKLSRASGTKVEKGDTFVLTYSLYQAGKDMKAIAAERNLSVGTIETHFAKFIEEGKVDIYDIYNKERIDKIMEVSSQNAVGQSSFSSVKSLLPEDFTYGEIRAAFKHLSRLKEQA
ncbi:MAG: helix-turn-helix domain-containing protein [Chitinophagales bacterium]|nr:helix-turn-helix domain-containing protein [Chitinophagales bacterium]